MADQDSKKARREAAREERRRAEEAAAAAAAKARVKNTIITVVSLAVVGGLVWLAWDNTQKTEFGEAELVDRAAAAEAREALACEVLAEDAPYPDRTHYDPAGAPPADTLYTDVRPTHSGPHFNQTHPIIRAGASQQLEERAVTHSLEHGSVGFFYDPDQFDSVGELEALSERLNDNGFAVQRAGAGIYVAPYTDPGISSGKAFAMRAWGQAVDCDGYDEDVALAFVIEHFGTHGIAPEGNFAPFPEALLKYSDGEGQDTTEGAGGGEGDPGDHGDTTGDPAEGEADADAPAEDAPAEDAPVEDAPAEDAPAEDSGDAPADESTEG